jgi:protein gp37
VKGHPFEHGFDLRLVPEKLSEPLRWSDPKAIFVNSMSDLLHERVPFWYLATVVKVMRVARWHTYQVLTKRSKRLFQMLSGPLLAAAKELHIWWGVSVEDRTHGLPRIADLQAAPAAVRFLSVEPLLEDLGEIPLEGISWVIVGGESGPGARPMKPEWVWSIKQQCDAARVPFFFKQWGGVHKKTSGRMLDGKVFDDAPIRAQNEVLPKPTRVKLIAEIERIALVGREERTFQTESFR